MVRGQAWKDMFLMNYLKAEEINKFCRGLSETGLEKTAEPPSYICWSFM